MTAEDPLSFLLARVITLILGVLIFLVSPYVASAAISWEPIGVGGGGAFTLVAFDPTDPDRIFTGSNVGGPYRSSDGGETWAAITQGIMGLGAKYRNPPGGMVFDPRDSQIIYKGARLLFMSTDGGDSWSILRDYVTYRLAIDRARPDIIYASGKPRIWNTYTFQRSTNGGVDWEELRDGLPSGLTVFAIEVDTLTADVYVCTDMGVFRNEGGVSTWVDISDGLPIEAMETVYWANGSGGHQMTYPMALHRSQDTGLTLYVLADSLFKRTETDTAWWKPDNTNLGGWGDAPYQTVVVHPGDPNIVYVAGSNGLRRSTNGGDTWAWTACDNEDGWLGQVQCDSSSWQCNIMSLAISESDPAQLLMGTGVSVRKSTDGGATWGQLYTNESPPGAGWWRTTGIDPVYGLDVAFDPTDPDRLYGGFADIGFLRSKDRGETFQRTCQGMQLSSVGEDVFAIGVDPEDPATLYAAVHHYFDLPATEGKCSVIARSTDRGESWNLVGHPDEFPEATIRSLALGTNGPAASRRIYAALNVAVEGDTSLAVYVSDDAGGTWQERSSGLPDPNPYGGSIRLTAARIVVAGNDDHAYLSVAAEYTPRVLEDPDVMGGVWETTDAGVSWNLLTSPDLVRSVNDIAVDPSDPEILYLAVNDHVDWYAYDQGDTTWFYPGGVYKSTDGGSTWEMKIEDHLIQRVTISPLDPGLIYAGSRDWVAWWQEDEEMVYPGGITLTPGVLRSPDGGETWTWENDGLGQLDIWSLICDPNEPGTLYAGTRGGGLYRGSDSGVIGVQDRDGIQDPRAPAAWLSAPSPFTLASKLTFGFRSGGSRIVRLTLHDVTGQRVRTLQEGPLPAGVHSLLWDGRDGAGRPAASGIYFLRLQAAGAVATERIVWVR